MLAIYIILLVAVPYYAHEQRNPFQCFRMVRRACGRDGIPRTVPDVISKLQNACSGITQYLSCYSNVREECDPLGNTIADLQEVYEYVRSVCEEDSSTYRVLSNNLQCLASSVERIESLCHKMSSELKLKFFRENVQSHVGDIDSLTSADKYCLNRILLVTCGSVVAGTRCGDEVENIISDLTTKLTEHGGLCTTEMSALKGTLSTAFRDAFKADESFMYRIRYYSGKSDVEDTVEEKSI